MIVYLARDIPPFVMYCVNGKPRSSLIIESTDSMILLYPQTKDNKSILQLELQTDTVVTGLLSIVKRVTSPIIN